MPSKNPEIAVLQTQVDGLIKTSDSIEHKVDTLLDRFETTAQSFATKADLEAVTKVFDDKIKDARRFNWMTHTMTAILTAFLIAIAYWIVADIVKK